MSTKITPPPSGNIEAVSEATKPVASPRKISRRKMLALTGTATLVLVAGGGVWRAADQGVFSTGEGPAYIPWTDWRTPTKGPLDLVRPLSWQPIPITPNPGSSRLRPPRSTFLPTPPAALARLILFCGKCIWGWVVLWKTYY